MPLIFKYFWFIGAAFMFANIVMWRRRMLVAVERGRATRAEVDRFVVWLMIWFVAAPLVFAFVALAAGWSSPFCAGTLMFDTTPRTVVALVNLVIWGWVLWWVWRGTGADFLSRILPGLGGRQPSYEKTYSPRVVRAAVTALVLFSSVGAIAGRDRAAIPSDVSCPVTQR